MAVARAASFLGLYHRALATGGSHEIIIHHRHCRVACAAFKFGYGGHGPGRGEDGEHHRTIDGVVTAEKSGLLTVKTSEGSTMSVTQKASERHGHAVSEGRPGGDAHPQRK